MPGQGVHLHSKQQLQETNLYAIQLCEGTFVPSNGPGLTAIAQDGLDEGVKQFAFDSGVMNVQLLTSTMQTKHCWFGSFAEALQGCWKAPCGTYGSAQVLEK